MQTIQTPNISVAPYTTTSLTAFDFNSSTPVVNTLGLATGNMAINGNYFTLPIGAYIVDYEMSLGSAGSIGLYTGTSLNNLSLISTSIAGSTTATTWIHGRHIVSLTQQSYLIVSSVVGTAAVVTAGTATGNYITRITFLKVG